MFLLITKEIERKIVDDEKKNQKKPDNYHLKFSRFSAACETFLVRIEIVKINALEL